MVGILLQYVAKTKPGARSPSSTPTPSSAAIRSVSPSSASPRSFGLDVVVKIVTLPTAVDVRPRSPQAALRRSDFTIFHGYVLAPLPEFVNQAKQPGLVNSRSWVTVLVVMDNSFGQGRRCRRRLHGRDALSLLRLTPRASSPMLRRSGRCVRVPVDALPPGLPDDDALSRVGCVLDTARS